MNNVPNLPRRLREGFTDGKVFQSCGSAALRQCLMQFVLPRMRSFTLRDSEGLDICDISFLVDRGICKTSLLIIVDRLTGAWSFATNQQFGRYGAFGRSSGVKWVLYASCAWQGERRSECDQRPTRILPVSYASQHDPLTLVDVSLECVPGRACQTTRRGCAWPSGTQPDVRQPANRSTLSCLQGRLQQFYEP